MNWSLGWVCRSRSQVRVILALCGLSAWCALCIKDGIIIHKHIPSPKEIVLLIAIGVWECKQENGTNHTLSWVTTLMPWGLGPRASFFSAWLYNLGWQQHHQLVLVTELTLSESPFTQGMLPLLQNRTEVCWWKGNQHWPQLPFIQDSCNTGSLRSRLVFGGS